MITVTPYKHVAALMSMMREWPDRRQAMMRHLVQGAAYKAVERIRGRLPQQAAVIADSLKVARVAGQSPEEPAYAVVLRPNRQVIPESDTSSVLLYVTPKAGKRGPTAAKILKAYNPWTVDTLLYVPKASEAAIMTRKAAPAEVAAVSVKRKADLIACRKQLATVGVRPPNRPLLNLDKRPTTLPDVAFESLQLEFGLNNTKAVPHWRPSLREVLSVDVRQFGKSNTYIWTFTRPSYNGWSGVRGSRAIRLTEVQKFGMFQQRLGIRA